MTVTVLRDQITMRDPSLPHQIVLNFTTAGGRTGHIAVSCNCRRTATRGTPNYVPLDARLRWDDPAGPMQVWREHMAQVT
jgi:hypothetical protein